MSDYLRTVVRGYKIINNSDPEINYESLGLPRPANTEEEIRMNVSIRKDAIMFVRESGLEDIKSVIGTDYNIEYHSYEECSILQDRLDGVSQPK